MINPLIGMPQGLEWLVILAIVVLVFGAAKLPDLARSSGQALRIFKTETKSLRDEDDDKRRPARAARDRGPQRGRHRHVGRGAPRASRRHHRLSAGVSTSVRIAGLVGLFNGRPAPCCRPGRPDGALGPLPGVPRATAALPAGLLGRAGGGDPLPAHDLRRRLRPLPGRAEDPGRGHVDRHDERRRCRPAALADAVRLRRGDRDRALLALPGVGLRAAGALRPGAEDVARLRGRRGAALHHRRRARLRHAAGRAGGADRLQPRRRHQPHRLQRLPPVLHPHPVRLRPGLQHPGVRGAAQLRRRRQGLGAQGLPAVDHHRHLRLRRRGDALGRPLHDDADGGADGAAVLRLRGDRPDQRPAPGASTRSTRGLGRPTSSHRSDEPPDGV